jgi:hypothetical protein
VAKALSTRVSIILTQISIHAEDGSQQSATFTHVIKGPALMCPIMPLVGQHFCTHFKPYKLRTNNQNLINNKEAYIALISLLKPQTIKIIFINKK